MRGVDRNRVRKMAHATVLVFVRLLVPVSSRLKAKRHHRDSH